MKKFVSLMIVALFMFATSGLFSSCGGNAKNGYDYSVITNTKGKTVDEKQVKKIDYSSIPVKTDTETGKLAIQKSGNKILIDDIDFANNPGYKPIEFDHVVIVSKGEKLYFLVFDHSYSNSYKVMDAAKEWWDQNSESL